METEVYVLGARRYRFADRETGEKREGVKVWYAEPNVIWSDERRGHPTDAVSVPYSWWEKLVEVPGRYRFEIEVGLRGRPQILNMEYVGAVEILASAKAGAGDVRAV